MTAARARRVRRWSAVCALFLLALTVACQNNSFRMADSGGRFIALRGSTLQVGWSAQAPAGWTVDHNGWPFGLNAWRPYRTVGKNWDYLVIPLWLPLSIAVVLVAYTHGWLSHGGAGSGLCGNCGYVLVGLAPQAGSVRCPECGREQRIAPQP